MPGLSALLTVGALIAALVASTFWASSAAFLLPFGLAAAVLLLAQAPLARRQVAIPTRPATKRAFRIGLVLVVLAIVAQAAHEILST